MPFFVSLVVVLKIQLITTRNMKGDSRRLCRMPVVTLKQPKFHSLYTDIFTVILDMNRTLLVEEGDDNGDNRQDKKKREKEKFPDAAGNIQFLSSWISCQ